VFAQGQLRIICDNSYGEEFEPDAQPGDEEHISHESFMPMFRKALADGHKPADATALLKRSVVVINGKKALYLRLPGTDKKPVRRIEYPNGKRDFIADEAKPALGAYRKGSLTPPDGQTDGLVWSQHFLEIAYNKTVGMPRTKMLFGPGLCGEGSLVREIKPHLEDSVVTARIQAREEGKAEDAEADHQPKRRCLGLQEDVLDGMTIEEQLAAMTQDDDPESNVAMHSEGGHFQTEIGSGCSFADLDEEMAAAVALQEGQNGMGEKLFNADGSLRVHRLGTVSWAEHQTKTLKAYRSSRGRFLVTWSLCPKVEFRYK